MNYENPVLLDSLAAAYALGVLRGAARTRFERVCARQATAQTARQRWEDRLLPLALAVAPLAPRGDLWPSIQRRLAGAQRPPARAWRLATAAAAALAVIALLIAQLVPWQRTEWQLVANIAPANAATQWRVQRSADTQRITIQTLQAVSHAPATSFELWVLPADGSTPVSLGVIPESGSLEHQLTDRQRQLLLTAHNLAVTVEPAGGSPNGLPSGAPIIVAPIATTG